MKNPVIQQKLNEIEDLQRQMNTVVSEIQQKQYKLMQEIELLEMDEEECDTIMNHQWDPLSVKKIEDNLKS